MKIGLIDCELLNVRKPNGTLGNSTFFPNLSLMKLSSYHKNKGDTIELISSYSPVLFGNNIENYDKIYVSKVFEKTPYNSSIENLNSNIIKGGTGFFYDESPKLDNDVEHSFPDYSLYKSLEKNKKYKHNNASIGFLTRGCFRQCPFCVNRHYKRVVKASPLEEFLDKDKKNIILLDDNFLGYSNWKDEINILKYTKKYFQFNQGLDMRIMNSEKAEALLSARYLGDYIFAFDNIADQDIIKKKLNIWNDVKKNLGKGTSNQDTKLFLLSAYDREGKFDKDFYEKDIRDLLWRIDLIMRNYCKGYVMLYKPTEIPYPYSYIYEAIKSWINSNRGNWNSQSLYDFILNNRSVKTSKPVFNWHKENGNNVINYYFKDMYWNNIHS